MDVDSHNLPLVLAGKCGGRINVGQHLSFAVPGSRLTHHQICGRYRDASWRVGVRQYKHGFSCLIHDRTRSIDKQPRQRASGIGHADHDEHVLPTIVVS